LRFEKPDYAELVLAVVIVWGICDGLSTLLAAEFAGVHMEANPLIRMLLPTPTLAFAVNSAVRSRRARSHSLASDSSRLCRDGASGSPVSSGSASPSRY
jgi:hypothetical protein